MKATTSIGMTMQLVDKNGMAIRRKWFGSLEAMKAWLDWQYPHRDALGYTIEIFYDEA